MSKIKRIQLDISGKGYKSQQDRFYEWGGDMCSIPSARTENKLMTISPDKKIRRLTEIECERLQGFPDNWTSGISSTQRYKCLGNAVTVNIVELIARRLNPL
jgi:DNA (cytosine-5)-methyltransferase 1